jgi:putative transposase
VPAIDNQTQWELRGAAGLLGKKGSRTPRLTESQIAFIFQQAGEGTPLSEICAAVGLTDAAYLRWRRQFGGLLPSEYNYVQELEAQVRRLQLELADLLDLPEDSDADS